MIDQHRATDARRGNNHVAISLDMIAHNLKGIPMMVAKATGHDLTGHDLMGHDLMGRSTMVHSTKGRAQRSRRNCE
jgi:hypothetical protein